VRLLQNKGVDWSTKVNEEIMISIVCYNLWSTKVNEEISRSISIYPIK
jgi:hypothetical protein